MMDTIKDYVFPKRFSILAYVCVIIHFHCGVILAAIATALRFGEEEKFSCAVDTKFATHKIYVEKTCFSIYDDAYNSPVRFYAFIVLNFGSVVVVSVIYSLAVGNRIDETEKYSSGSDKSETGAKKGNVEPGRKLYVFYFYFIHLVARLMLGILFTILQHVLYPSGFDSKFSCVYPDIKQSDPNITAAQNASVTLSSHVTCTNSAAQDKQFWGTFVSVCNVIFAIITLLEVAYLIWYQFPCFNTRSNVPWSCDSQFITEYFLQKEYIPSEDDKFTGIDNCTPNSIDIYKQNILKASLNTLDINYGANISLDDMFIDVVIQTEQAPHKFLKGMTRHEIYDVYMEVPKHSICLKEIKDLFYPNEDTKGNSPRTILALGRPGIGKTVLTTKIMHDWANGVDEFYHDKITFLFKFRCFNLSEFQNVTLKKFLRFGAELNEDKFESIFEEILHNSKKIIVIFDGLDELCSNLKEFKNYVDQSKTYSNDPDIPMSAMFLFIKIVFGYLLEEATILVTSRPTASDVYSKLKFDRKVEIIGFTLDKIEKYVEQFCANHEKNDLKPKILSHIKSSSEIKNLCYIPVNSFIVCVTLLNCLHDPDNDNPLPTTLTELYQAALVYFHKNHDRNESKGCYQKVIKELQWLAFDGMKNDQLIFYGELVNEQMKESGLLHCLPVPFFQIQAQVCFIHLTVQEFLAAKHIVETKEPEDINEFISSHVEHGKWHLVLQFLAGLLGRRMKMSDQYRSCVLAFTEHFSCEISDENIVCNLDPSQVLVMKCLRETKDEGIAKETAATSALKGVTCIRNNVHSHSSSEYAAMVFVCKHLNFLASLTLKGIPDFDCLLQVTKLLQERCIEKLSLEMPIVYRVELDLEHVLSALTDSECCINHEHSKLTQFTLNDFHITDAGVSSLIEFLLQNAHRICLQKLHLRGTKITSCGIAKFCDVLGNEICNQLIDLHLGWSDIGDGGVRTLCNALRREEHKLQRLNISSSLTTGSIFALVEVLGDEHCAITDLNLVSDAIGEEGVRMLCDVLKQEQCKLAVLDISNCSLTYKCMPYLTEALGDEKCRLTDLSLGSNDIGDESVCTLFAALRLEQCSLTKLDLGYCSLTEKCMTALCEALSHEHCGLINLNLGENDIGGEGVRMLCCALRKEQCKLTELDLSDCSLTDECLPSFCKVLRDERCRLTSLDLGSNAFTDKYLSLLSDTLKLEHCCLQYLGIWSCNFTDEGERLLEDVENFEHCKARRLRIEV
ncbi:NACHT, LRR and PYD domains-containing 14-like [Paramuricea clavata]|uniref:NACHT, LRR and PYD domains-containing 14-like n=1 Tax=Paramuricea clavata TaxID=317549 RepID=A0A7D9EDR1_PARCT|nr:NACHT, LRR and PYD domains-containing 14-like [Paramuricea clavata]